MPRIWKYDPARLGIGKHTASKKGYLHRHKPAARPLPCPLTNHQRMVEMRSARLNMTVEQYQKLFGK